MTMKNICHLVFIFSCFLNIYPGARAIGVNYGLVANNLPPPSDVVNVLKQRNVEKVRIFEPNPDVLAALHDSAIPVIIGTLNADLLPLATDPEAATKWIGTHILPHTLVLKIEAIAVGNEVYPSDLTQYIPGAMQNLKSTLSTLGLVIPVTTAVSMQVLSTSYPPSAGAFQEDVTPIMTQIASILSSDGTPLLVNVYPYFARIGDPANVPLEYALFSENATPVQDGQLVYNNLFDAMVDSVYSALEKVGGTGVEIAVTETGWPSDGGNDASVENAQTYVNNLIKHVSSGQGTPKRPGKAIDTYIFSLFNENLKPGGVEQHWGLFYPDFTEVYHANL